MPFKHLKKTTKAKTAAKRTNAHGTATTATAATAASQTTPNNDKKLRLELPLITDVYASTSNMPRRARRAARFRNAAQQQQLVRHTYAQEVSKSAAMMRTCANECVKCTMLPAAATTTTQQELVTELMRVSTITTGHPVTHDVRNHIEAARAKLHSALPIQLPTVDEVALKNARRKRAAEEAAQLRTIKANCIYFDRYLPSAFDLTTTEGVRKLEAHFFPSANSNEQQIGDSLASRRKSMSVNATSGSAIVRPIKTVLQHAKLPDRPKSMESKRSPMQRILKKRFTRTPITERAAIKPIGPK